MGLRVPPVDWEAVLADSGMPEPGEYPEPSVEDDPTIHPELPHESPSEPFSGPPKGPAPTSAAERVRSRWRGKSDGTRADPSPGAKRASRPIPPKPREGTLVKPLTELYVTAGMTIAPFDPACSMAIISNAEECARRLEMLARENESVRRAILAITATSAWGGVMVAHLPIIAMIMTHHGPPAIRERAAGIAMMTNPAAMAAMMQEAEKAKAGDTPK
jgi:hypothetical protein